MNLMIVQFSPLCKNIRLMTEFDLLFESEYLVGIQLVGKDSSRLNKSAIVIRLSLITE